MCSEKSLIGSGFEETIGQYPNREARLYQSMASNEGRGWLAGFPKREPPIKVIAHTKFNAVHLHWRVQSVLLAGSLKESYL